MTALFGWIYQQPYALCVVTVVFWAGNATLARGLSSFTDPIDLSFYRWVAAFLLLLPFTWGHLRRDRQAIRRGLPILTVLAALGVSGFGLLMYLAAHWTTATNIALFQTAMPAAIVAISALFFRDSIGRWQTVAMGLCFLGGGYIITRGDPLSVFDQAVNQGDAIMVLAVLDYALFSALLRLRPAMHHMSFLTAVIGLGTLLLLPVYLVDGVFFGFMPLSVDLIPAIAYMALCPSILAVLCWSRGVELIGANRAGLFVTLLPVFAALFAGVLLGEVIATYHAVGLVMIVTGIVLFNLRRGR